MLIDFTDQKATIEKNILAAVKEELSKNTVVGQFTTVRLHEGARTKITRDDGTSDETVCEKIESVGEISSDDLLQLTPVKYIEQIKKIISELISKQEKLVFTQIDKLLDKYDQTIDAKGGPLTPEDFLKAISKIRFDPRHGFPTLVTGTKGVESLKKVIEDIDKTPELSKQLSEILSKKIEEEDDREASRKLVG